MSPVSFLIDIVSDGVKNSEGMLHSEICIVNASAEQSGADSVPNPLRGKPDVMSIQAGDVETVSSSPATPGISRKASVVQRLSAVNFIANPQNYKINKILESIFKSKVLFLRSFWSLVKRPQLWIGSLLFHAGVALLIGVIAGSVRGMSNDTTAFFTISSR